jgi:hypothetical protein
MKTIASYLAMMLPGEMKLRRQLASFVKYVVLMDRYFNHVSRFHRALESPIPT